MTSVFGGGTLDLWNAWSHSLVMSPAVRNRYVNFVPFSGALGTWPVSPPPLDQPMLVTITCMVRHRCWST